MILRKTNNKGISSYWYYRLRWVAIITMLIDHCVKLLYNLSLGKFDTLLRIGETIGRTAFPIFCFLLVECFHYTKDRKKHLFGLLAIAVISEYPYNICFSQDNTILSQNVCWLLALSFLIMAVLNTNIKTCSISIAPSISKAISKFVKIYIIIIGSLIAELCCFDYGGKGLLFIIMLYAARHLKHIKLCQAVAFVFFAVAMKSIMYAEIIVSLILIYIAESNTIKPLDNVITGRGSRLICKWFYPAHMYILAFIYIILR